MALYRVPAIPTQFIIDRVEGIDGFYGASSTERLPTEIAIKAQIESFKSIRLPKRAARKTKGRRG